MHRVLTRYGLARLRWLDRPTGRVIRRMESAALRRSGPRRCQEAGQDPRRRRLADARPLGRQTQSGKPTKAAGQTSKHRNPVRGYHFLHTAIDAHSRLAYSELLADERKETAAAFWLRANAWFTECGITVRNVLTDNGSCYRSHDFRDALGDIEHRRTRPYRPQTNGKVERFHRTLADEWAYARLYRSDAERCDEFPTMAAHLQSPPRPHRTQGQPPASRVPNLSGQYTTRSAAQFAPQGELRLAHLRNSNAHPASSLACVSIS